MSIRVSLTSLVYPTSCVEQAIAAFASRATIHVRERTTRGCVVEIVPAAESAADLSLTASEFLNHLLDLSVEDFIIRSSSQ